MKRETIKNRLGVLFIVNILLTALYFFVDGIPKIIIFLILISTLNILYAITFVLLNNKNE